MKIGNLVQLLDVHGDAHKDTLGVITGFCPDRGNIFVHWFAGVMNFNDGSAFQWGRLKVVA